MAVSAGLRVLVPARLTVAACKDLANLERDFRHIKADDRDLRPIWHRPEPRQAACLRPHWRTHPADPEHHVGTHKTRTQAVNTQFNPQSCYLGRRNFGLARLLQTFNSRCPSTLAPGSARFR